MCRQCAPWKASETPEIDSWRRRGAEGDAKKGRKGNVRPYLLFICRIRIPTDDLCFFPPSCSFLLFLSPKNRIQRTDDCNETGGRARETAGRQRARNGHEPKRVGDASSKGSGGEVAASLRPDAAPCGFWSKTHCPGLLSELYVVLTCSSSIQCRTQCHITSKGAVGGSRRGPPDMPRTMDPKASNTQRPRCTTWMEAWSGWPSSKDTNLESTDKISSSLSPVLAWQLRGGGCRRQGLTWFHPR